jgi:multiple sugar transport system substrate-binding protein
MKRAKLSRRDFLKMSALTATGAALAACGGGGAEEPIQEPETGDGEEVAPPEPEAVELDLWGWWEPRMAKYELAANAFTEQNPNITIVVTSVPDNLLEKVYSSVSAGTGPNMLKMSEWYHNMKEEDLLLEFPESRFPDNWWEEAYPTVYWPPYQGYIVPAGTDCSVLYYNRAHFEEAGLDPEAPPATWDEAIDYAQQLTKRDGSGLLAQAGWLPAIENPAWDQSFQQGGTLVSDDTPPEATVDTSEWVQAWQFIYDMYYEYQAADVGFIGALEGMGTGLAGMAEGLTWMIGEFQGTYADMWPDLGIAKPPTPTGTADPLYGWKNYVLAVSALTGKPDEYEATFDFLEFLYKDGGRQAFKEVDMLLGIAPVRADLFDDSDILAMPGMQDVILEIEPLEYDNVNRPAEFNDYWLSDVMFRIIDQQESIPDVLADADAKLQQMIDDGLTPNIR